MVMRQDRAGRRCWCLMMALVMVGLATVACGADEDSTGATGGITPVASVAPTPSPALTPSAEAPKFVKVTATPAPGTKQDALFLEAKKVYETYLEQTLLFEQEGGGESLPLELQKTVDGPWENVLEEYYKKVEMRGHHVTSQSAGFGKVTLSRIKTEHSYLITLRSCVDQRQWVFVDKSGGEVSRGNVRQIIMSMAKENGSLVITAASSKGVDKCVV
ncbi:MULTISPECIES: hypothetical protein [Cutibacterium]|nr:hypothetical protein HMPREF9206_0788 [Cutibacterium acnes J139]